MFGALFASVRRGVRVARTFCVPSFDVRFGFSRTCAVPFESLIHVNTFRCAQLYDKCGRPTEVERLVKLGANGSGYKFPFVRLVSRLVSRLSLRLPLSLSFSLFSS